MSENHVIPGAVRRPHRQSTFPMFLVADYVKERSDLVLVEPDGQTVVIDNYFEDLNLDNDGSDDTRKQAKTRANRLNK